MEEFVEAVGKLSKPKLIIGTATVKTVEGNHCVLKRQHLPDLFEVKLGAIQSESLSVKITPKIGSVVTYALTDLTRTEAIILKYSEVNTVEVTINGAKFSINQEGKFKISNDFADLKAVLKSSLDVLKTAVINTPSGPGSFAPNVTNILAQNSQKINQLFE